MLLDGDPAHAHKEHALYALARQSYPEELIEVLEPGAGEPDGDIVVLLDAGAVPAPGFVEAHARWHHAVGDAVTFGALVPKSARSTTTPSASSGT